MNLDFLTRIVAGAIGMGFILCAVIGVVCAIAAGHEKNYEQEEEK